MSADEDIRAFELDGYIVLFNGKDMTLRLLPCEAQKGSKNIKSNSEMSDKFMTFTFDGAQSKVEKDCSKFGEQFNMNNKETGPHRPSLSRLSINVSNQCNMACKYCYANQGTYYTAGILMDKDTALKTINFAFRHFSSIELINFFGGEPTLNQEIIKLICEYSLFLQDRGILLSAPRFGITTNGYVLTDKMLHLLRKYDLGLSISLDGPKDIHDKLRTLRNGSGTYDTIVNNLRRVIDLGITPEFECTYTWEHYRTGIFPSTMMDYFYDNFGCRTLHCPTVAVEKNSVFFVPLELAMELYSQAIRYSVENLMKGIPKSISIATRLLNSLASRTPIYHYCPAGKDSLTINADGRVYPCFMLMGEGRFWLYDLNTEGSVPCNLFQIEALIREGNKWQNSVCKKCWAESLCFGCLAEDLVRGTHPYHRSASPGQSKHCDFKRTLIEVFLLSVAKCMIKNLKHSGN